MLLFPALAAPGDAVVLRVGDQTLTGLELSRACARHWRRLAAAGVPRGAHVAVWTQPALETAVALVANAACGVVSLPLDPKLGPLELQHLAATGRPVVALAADPAAVQGRLAGVPVLEASRQGEGTPTPERAVDDTPLLILSTSGTTGPPKGAVLSARNVAACLDGLAEAWRWTAADTVVHALPLFHVHGLVLGLFGAVRAGGALHWLPRFEPRAVAAALAARQSLLFAVPTMYHRLAEACADPQVVAGLQAARLLISGSAPLARVDQQRLEALTGRRVLERYGLTETLIVCAQRDGGAGEAGSVGPPLAGVELRLVDDERRPLPPGDATAMGEVALRGPTVFGGYLGQPDATAEVLDAQGWFYTGDLATRAADGSLRLVGRRATDLIKCGGFKVGAGEVEAALLAHPGVREAAVVGRPDADLGERIVAFVVADGVTAAELENHVAGLLSPHKRPREVRFLEALPRNAMGKVQKRALQAREAGP